MNRYLSYGASLPALLPIVGLLCSFAVPSYAASSAAPAQTAASDGEITAQVKQQLAGVESLKGDNIAVKTSDGVVTLSGTVKDTQQKSDATTAAITVEGVKVLDDELKTTPVRKRVADAKTVKATAKRGANDDRINADVQEVLAQSVPRRYKVDAKTDDGVVYLSGDVMDGAAIERLQFLVARVDGVKSVNTLALDAPFVTMTY